MGIIGVCLIISISAVGILAPVLAPNTNSRWDDVDRWKDLPRGAAPVWTKYVPLMSSKAPHSIKENPTISVSSAYKKMSYEYEYSYDFPPKAIVVYVRGEYKGDMPELIAEIVRPDGRSLQLTSETVRGENANGKCIFNHRMLLISEESQRTRIYKFAKKFEGDDAIDQSGMQTASVLFAKAQDNMINDPVPLEGSYELNLLLVGENTEIDDSRAIFKGRIYGLMGTDGRAHNIFLGWIWGARYALLIGLAVAGLTVLIGLFFGMTSAYYGGWVDELMQRINEIVMGIPILPILVIISLVWKRSIYVVILVLGLLYWRGIAKTIRARGLQIRQNTYVEASQALGASGGRIIRTHMIPQMLPYAFAEAALMVPVAIITAAGLQVLGLGDPNIVTWGTMLSQAHSAMATIRGMWWWVLLPGIGITLLGFGFISAGMAVERVVNPKMKQE